ncbi:MAG: DUF3667 domain-containing protein [Ferruginibacter sp.]
MSHLKQRKEQNCLNCNAVVNGRYCSICGQENLEPQESLWHLIVHFFNDITHFDGKFFSSVKYIVTKPGFLSSEYIRGRRMSYLNPVRFYVFTSFFFFLLFFTFIADKIDLSFQEDNNPQLSKKSSDKVDATLNSLGVDSLKQIEKKRKNNGPNMFGSGDYRDKKEYDSLKSLGLLNKSRLQRNFIEKGFKLKEKYENDGKGFGSTLIYNFLHTLPQTLFYSLPFFALVLQLLYFRSKNHYYVGHVIFTIHLYVFIYVDLLSIYLFGVLSEIKYLGWFGVLETMAGLGIIYYAYRAMRNFYSQSRWKTLLKLILLFFAFIFLSGIFAIIAIIFSIYKM